MSSEMKYRVVGDNNCSGDLHCWGFDDLEYANKFAKQLSETTGKNVEVCQYLGSWRPIVQPVEFVPAIEKEATQ